MKKASAITLSIIIMMLVLAALLAYTAFYIDEVTLRPVVEMQSTESDLRCFLILSNIIGSNYLRDSEPVPNGSLRQELIRFYGLNNVERVNLGDREELFRNVLLIQYGNSETVIAEEEIFWSALNRYNIPFECYTRVYGPIRIGIAALFLNPERYIEGGASVASILQAEQCCIDPTYAVGGCPTGTAGVC